MAFYITGDVHADHDIHKLSRENFPDGKNLTEDDYIFICGDFGLVWYDNPKLLGYKTQKHWIKWLGTTFPKTKILVTLGNHENYDMVSNLPLIEMFGDVVRKVNDQIYLFERGHIYTISDKKILSLSGAHSIDKSWRLSQEKPSTGKLWWEQELWTYGEEMKCVEILDKHNWKVDYVISHTAPNSIIDEMFFVDNKWGYREPDSVSDFFEYIFKKPLEFKSWWFGHWHSDKEYLNFTCSYQKIHKEIL